MKRHILCCIILMLLTGAWAHAQDSYTDRAQKYIEKYNTLAIQEQKRAGIPASITLGQGILETEAGASELMTKANNHFGIKCKSDWNGDKFLHTDDAPDECFKKYKCAEDSYKDHSDYLKRNQRYAKLFTLKTTDYKSWAVCLRSCGYATNPQYAQNLIKIIENFNLQNYTYSALDSSLLNRKPVMPEVAEFAEVAEDGTIISASPGFTPVKSAADSARNITVKKKDPVPPAPVTVSASVPVQAAPAADIDSSKIVTINDIKAFYARKGEMLLPYAVKYKIRYAHLLEMNDLPDAPLPFNTCVYLERKQTLGAHPTHLVKEGENLLMISQTEGVQLKRLMAMNMLNPNEEPVTGAVLYLQSATAHKPDVKINATLAHKTNAIVTGPDTIARYDNSYIAIDRSKHPPAKPADTTTHKTMPVAVNIPKPQPRVDTPKPAAVPAPKHVIVVAPAEDRRNNQPAVSPATAPEKPVTAIEKPGTTTEEEFTKLKADLDKIVYADDSKLIAKIENDKPQPKPADAPTAAKGAKYYTVKRGDTAFSIAKKNNITVDELLKWNNISASGIKAGKNLRIK